MLKKRKPNHLQPARANLKWAAMASVTGPEVREALDQLANGPG